MRPGPNKGVPRLFGNARNRRPYKNGSLEDLAGQTRGFLTAIKHLGYCLKTCSATWLCRCSECGADSEITRKQFQRATPYPCPVCQGAPNEELHMRKTPAQEQRLAQLTAEERALYAIVMAGREETKANVDEALREVRAGRENVLAFYAPRKFRLEPLTAGSSLSERQFGYKQKRGA